MCMVWNDYIDSVAAILKTKYFEIKVKTVLCKAIKWQCWQHKLVFISLHSMHTNICTNKPLIFMISQHIVLSETKLMLKSFQMTEENVVCGFVYFSMNWLLEGLLACRTSVLRELMDYLSTRLTSPVLHLCVLMMSTIVPV